MHTIKFCFPIHKEVRRVWDSFRLKKTWQTFIFQITEKQIKTKIFVQKVFIKKLKCPTYPGAKVGSSDCKKIGGLWKVFFHLCVFMGQTFKLCCGDVPFCTSLWYNPFLKINYNLWGLPQVSKRVYYFNKIWLRIITYFVDLP